MQLLNVILSWAYTWLCCVYCFTIGVNAAQGPDPQCLTCRGPSMCWTSNNSHAVTRTMHYFRQHNNINFVVSAAVEQVYSSTFKFCLLKMQEICPLIRFIFTSKCTKMRLVARLCPDPLGELIQCSPGSLAGLKGKERERGVGKGKGQGRPKTPWRRKMRHRNPQRDKNKEFGGTNLNLVSWFSGK